MNGCSLFKLYHFHTVMLFLFVTCEHFLLLLLLLLIIIISSGDATVAAFFWTLLTLRLQETSELLDESDNKISRLTARLAISKILAGLKERHPMWGATLGDARVKVKQKRKRKRKESGQTDRQHTWREWQADRSWAARQAASFPADREQHSHPHTRSCLPDRMLCMSCALNERCGCLCMCECAQTQLMCPRADFVFASVPLLCCVLHHGAVIGA